MLKKERKVSALFLYLCISTANASDAQCDFHIMSISSCLLVRTYSFIHSFIHAFNQSINQSINHSGRFYSAPSSPLLLRGAPDYSTDTVSESHAEAHRQL